MFNTLISRRQYFSNTHTLCHVERVMRIVHRSCSGLRRVSAPARTGNNRQYSHFRRKLSAPVDLLLRRGSAGCARYVAVLRRNQNVTATARIFNTLNICLHLALIVTERKRRNRLSLWTSCHVVGGLLSKTVGAKSIVGALCNQALAILQKRRRSCGYVGNVDAKSAPQWTSPDLLRLCWGCGAGNGRAPASMLRWGCAEVTPFIPAQGKPRRSHHHHDATAMDLPHNHCGYDEISDQYLIRHFVVTTVLTLST